MRINFYDARLNEDYQTVLVKERAVNYPMETGTKPQHYVDLMNDLLQLQHMAEEYCYLIALNTKCRILGVFLLSKGTVNQSQVGMREIFLRALLVGAVHILLIHNHPSGDVKPSNIKCQDLMYKKYYIKMYN